MSDTLAAILVVGAGALAYGVHVVERDTIQPIVRQIWVEEGPAERPDNAQAIAEVLIRRAERATRIKGKRVTVEDLQVGRELDRFTGPISAWEGFERALAAGERQANVDPEFRRRASAAAWRAWYAVRVGYGQQVAPGALWYRHQVDPPAEWRGQPIVRALEGPRGRSLALYAPKVGEGK